MPQPRKLDDESFAALEAIATERAKIPTDKELCLRFNISRSRIQQVMREVRKRLKVDICVGSLWNKP